MSDSDKEPSDNGTPDTDTSAAVDKVVGAFRAQREQGKSGAAEAEAEPQADAEPTQEPTPVTKLDDAAPAPQGGGGSEAPTKAFAIPAEVAAAAAAADAGLREENVVGDPTTEDAASEPSASEQGAGEQAAGSDSANQNDIVEHSIALTDVEDTADATPTAKISAEEIAAATAAAQTPTTQMPTPPAAPAPPAPTPAAPATTAAPKPQPQVVAPSTPDQKRKSGKFVAIGLAGVVVIAVIAIGLWYLLVGSSDQNKVADVAKDYQSAMSSGDLSTLRDITCGAKKEYYGSISDEAFAKAFAAQKARNELMTFDDVNAVQIDGDVARVGVDMYPSSDPSKTAPAQITLHKIDGAWKVCTEP